MTMYIAMIAFVFGLAVGLFGIAPRMKRRGGCPGIDTLRTRWVLRGNPEIADLARSARSINPACDHLTNVRLSDVVSPMGHVDDGVRQFAEQTTLDLVTLSRISSRVETVVLVEPDNRTLEVLKTLFRQLGVKVATLRRTPNAGEQLKTILA